MIYGPRVPAPVPDQRSQSLTLPQHLELQCQSSTTQCLPSSCRACQTAAIPCQAQLLPMLAELCLPSCTPSSIDVGNVVIACMVFLFFSFLHDTHLCLPPAPRLSLLARTQEAASEATALPEQTLIARPPCPPVRKCAWRQKRIQHECAAANCRHENVLLAAVVTAAFLAQKTLS
eukprot:75303-Pelagomonas_calceolata.AAC.4